MQEQNSEVNKPLPQNNFIRICITQAICMIVILIAVFVIKMFFGNGYQKVKKWYERNVLDETDVSEIFDGETSDEV